MNEVYLMELIKRLREADCAKKLCNDAANAIEDLLDVAYNERQVSRSLAESLAKTTEIVSSYLAR